jgi:Ca-activated chloride channel family protein
VVDPLKYRKPAAPPDAAPSPELLTVKLRYKPPEGQASKLLERAVEDDGRDDAAASGDFRFAAAVASFGLLLRDSPHKGDATWAAVLELAEASRGSDPENYRAEFVGLVRRVQQLQGR